MKIIDSSQKLEQLIFCWNVIKNKEQIYTNHQTMSFVDNYLQDIIYVRNNLAHCSSVIENGKEILKTRSGDLFFDTDMIIDIRKRKFENIMNYSLKYKNCKISSSNGRRVQF